MNAAYQASKDKFTVSVTALYDKLQGVETQVSQALVRESVVKLTRKRPPFRLMAVMDSMTDRSAMRLFVVARSEIHRSRLTSGASSRWRNSTNWLP